MRHSLAILAAICLSLAAASPGSGAETVDNFTTSQTIVLFPPGMIIGTVSGGGLAGGSRTTTIASTATNLGIVIFSAGGGTAVFESGPRATTTFLYNGPGLGAALAGQDDITVGFIAFELGNATSVDVTVTVDAGTSLTQTLTADAGAFDLVFDFPAAATSSVQVTFTPIGGNNTDFTLNGITAMGQSNMPPPGTPVPEPSSLIAWGLLGVIVLIGRRLGLSRPASQHA